jgi:cytochrome b561
MMSMLRNTRSRYGAISQALHWLTVVLVATAYLLSPGGSEQRIYAAAADFARQSHETTGMLVLTVVVARLLWRWIEPTPESPPMAPWMEHSAKIVHVALYALLIAIPSTAIAGAWLEGHPVTLLGVPGIGPMLPLAHDTGQSVANIHTILGNVIIWLAGLHAAAALFHHFVRRDRVLTSMLPAWQRSQALGESTD